MYPFTLPFYKSQEPNLFVSLLSKSLIKKILNRTGWGESSTAISVKTLFQTFSSTWWTEHTLQPPLSHQTLEMRENTYYLSMPEHINHARTQTAPLTCMGACAGRPRREESTSLYRRWWKPEQTGTWRQPARWIVGMLWQEQVDAPKSLMAQAAVMRCLSPGRSSKCRHLEKRGKTVSQQLATDMDKRKNSRPEGKLLGRPRLQSVPSSHSHCCLMTSPSSGSCAWRRITKKVREVTIKNGQVFEESQYQERQKFNKRIYIREGHNRTFNTKI